MGLIGVPALPFYARLARQTRRVDFGAGIRGGHLHLLRRELLTERTAELCDIMSQGSRRTLTLTLLVVSKGEGKPHEHPLSPAYRGRGSR